MSDENKKQHDQKIPVPETNVPQIPKLPDLSDNGPFAHNNWDDWRSYSDKDYGHAGIPPEKPKEKSSNDE